MTKFGEYEEKPIELYDKLREMIARWSAEDRAELLQIDGYQYIVLDEDTDVRSLKTFVTFCIGPVQMTSSEKDDVGYATFTFDRCRFDPGGFAFDARDVVLSPPEDLVIEEVFENLETLKWALNTRLITTAF